MNAYQKAVELIVGSRLKRLSDRYLSDVAKVYKAHHIPFETAYFPVFYLLSRYTRLKVSDVARELAITQSGASQMINALVKKGLVRYDRDLEDRRIRSLTLTPEGQALLTQVRPVWKAIRTSFRKLLDQGENSRCFFEALEEIEQSLTREPFFTRVSQTLQQQQVLEAVSFEPFTRERETAFKALALEWMAQNSFAGPNDPDIINQTADMISSGQGLAGLAVAGHGAAAAFYAAVNTQASGSAAIIEIFGIHEKWQQQGLDQTLLNVLLKELANQGTPRVSIVLNRRLTRLVHVFKAAGFTLDQMVHSPDKETGLVLTCCLNPPAVPGAESPGHITT